MVALREAQVPFPVRRILMQYQYILVSWIVVWMYVLNQFVTEQVQVLNAAYTQTEVFEEVEPVSTYRRSVLPPPPRR